MSGDDIVKKKRKKVRWDPAVLEGRCSVESERRKRIKKWDEKMEGLTIKLAQVSRLRDREVKGAFIGSEGQRSAEETVEG
tara:strand:- start:70 stop:309 length:240 start_codon:yes stop_codon:yes gene_type:complete